MQCLPRPSRNFRSIKLKQIMRVHQRMAGSYQDNLISTPQDFGELWQTQKVCFFYIRANSLGLPSSCGAFVSTFVALLRMFVVSNLRLEPLLRSPRRRACVAWSPTSPTSSSPTARTRTARASTRSVGRERESEQRPVSSTRSRSVVNYRI